MINLRIYCACLAFILLVSMAASAQTPPSRPSEGNTLYGDLKVETKESGAQLPMSYVIILYTSAGQVYDRQSIPNNGRYRFLAVPNGEYEIGIEVDNQEVARIPFLLNEGRFTDVRRDLMLELKSAMGTAAADIYKRGPETAALMDKAMAANAKKEQAEALALFQQVVAADPKDFEAWVELGSVYFVQKNYGEAEKAYRRALEAKPSYPVALVNLGKLQFMQKKFDDAILTLTRAVAANPRSADAHFFLGESYLQTKKGSKAVPELEEALRLDPIGHADAHLRLAALYNGAGYKNLAAAEYEKFLAKRPDYPDRQKLEKYVQDNKKP